MIRTVIQKVTEHRLVTSWLASAGIGASGLATWPLPASDWLLHEIRLGSPATYAAINYAYATLWFSSSFFATITTLSFLYVLVLRTERVASPRELPPYPPPDSRQALYLVLGEQHHRTSRERSDEPSWLVVPERGLYTGMLIVGAIGSGKTTACMYPYVEQLLAHQASDPQCKPAGLILEVKGDFCRHVRDILRRHGRLGDYVEVGLDSPYRYNPLHNDLDAYALAYGIATLMTNLFGRGKEPFWQQASTNLVKFIILLHQTLDGYVTLFQIYEHAINPDKLKARIAEGEQYFAADTRRVLVDKREHLFSDALLGLKWQDEADGKATSTEWSVDVEEMLRAAGIPWDVVRSARDPRWDLKVAQFEAVKRWFEDDWTRIEPKLRTSIVEGVSVFLSLFDDSPRVKHTFCPPKSVYEDPSLGGSESGIALPSIADLIAAGKVVALNFPIAMNPGLARALGTMLKQDFQRAVLQRIPRTASDRGEPLRPVLFVCDEYQAFATTGENEPSGDEKFFSLARQAKCIPIVATQSISSLRSTLPGESWRTLIQGLRTKVFLTLTDDFSAHIAAELCGMVERLKPGYSITEAGQDAKVSLLTGRPGAHRSTITAAKTYTLQYEYVFQPRVFTELQNAEAIVLTYDGVNPLPPSFCYLKPHYLNVQKSYFDHVASGAL